MYFCNKVTVTNFLLAVFVVFLHSQNVELYESVSASSVPAIEYFISRTIGNLAVPTFFLLSSYLFYRNFTMDKLAKKYRERFHSVVIPYLLWNFLYYLAFVGLTAFPLSRYFMDTKAVEFSAFKLVDAVFLHRYNGVYWFMQQLIYFIMLAPVVWYLLKRKCGILFVGTIAVLGCICTKFPDNEWGIRVDMLAYWFLGCWMAVHGKRVFEDRGKHKTTVLAVLLFVILISWRFGLEFYFKGSFYQATWSQILLFVNVVSFWFALNLFEFSYTTWWMKITFFIYSTHPLLVDTVKKGMAAFLPDLPSVSIVSYIASVVISLAIILGIAQVLMRYCPNVWSVLNGGRNPLENGNRD